ncbi:MAG: manganese efflux pump [Spirochaetales bacterium]|nr:manganese efflux pump [Spirochaetales bacterium]
MSHIEILFISIGLAMDAFAVSLGAATCKRISGPGATFRLSFHFGLFQFIMTVIGWFVGGKVASLIASYDHWLAFALLAWVGGRMIYESMNEDPFTGANDLSRGLNLIVLSLATSIDALAVGFSLALLHIDIWYPSVMIGIITGSLSLVGIRMGHYLGVRFGKRMGFAGGIILIAIGIRILVEHMR